MTEVLKILRDLAFYGLEKMGLYYSRYRGYVSDNQDPKGYGRIKVSVPEIYGDRVFNYWAWPSSNYSGIGYGVQVIPQIDDLVWVEFEKGNPHKPLWSYGHFAKDEKPEELKDIKNFWFRTPAGNTIEFNDTNSTIKITSANGKILHIGEDFISLGSSEASAQPGVLGNTAQEKIEALIQILIEAKVNTALGPQPFYPDVIVKLQELKETIGQIKSEIVTLD